MRRWIVRERKTRVEEGDEEMDSEREKEKEWKREMRRGDEGRERKKKSGRGRRGDG